MRSLGLLVLLLPACVADSGAADIPDADWTAGKADGVSRHIVSAEAVERLGGDLSSLSPPCRTADLGHACEDYLSTGSALGDFGPIGAYGPLGSLGPLGDNVWNSSYWISGAGDWSSWSSSLDGPLSASGPLGPDGPLGDRAYYETLPSINDWAKQLQGGGVWTVLGPLGPLGSLGPLGPLGPVGAHGYAVDDSGNFVHDGDVVRSVKTSFGQTFELVEMYDEATAAAMAPNDTSFVVTGEIADRETDSYEAKSLAEQFVTILVVPEKQLDNFDLTVKSTDGRVLASSHARSYIDWIQLEAPRGGRMKIEVSLAATGHFLSNTYRLYVVGSGPRFHDSDITGAHRKAF